MTKTESTSKTLNSAEYAKLIGKSERTARRHMAKGRWAKKIKGRWYVTFTQSELRNIKRSLVDIENAASHTIGSTKFGQEDESFRAAQVRKAYARNALDALGYGDIVLQIDHMRIWRGRQDKYGLATFRKAFADLERMVSA